MYRIRTSFGIFALALVALAATGAPAHAGPPWVSVEYPSNPFDKATRGSLATIHTYHHGIPMRFPVSAVADGIVNGRRQTIALSVASTPVTGVWVVNGKLPEGGNWVLSATMTDLETNAIATALIAISSNGELSAIKVPYDMRNGWIAPRKATTAEVDALLSSTLAASRARDGARAGALLELPSRNRALAGLGLLLLLPLGVSTLKRRR